MKVYSAYFAHESNSFSPLPTTLDSYSQNCLYRPATGEGRDILDQEFTDDLAFIPILQSRNHEVCIGPLAATTPSAPTRKEDYELIRDELILSLKEAMPVDAVIIFMHGAQLAVGYSDCAGDILHRIRAVVGTKVPIGVELDLHCNITAMMLDSADVIIPCKEYPHTDFAEEGRNLVGIIEGAVKGDLHPKMTFSPVPILGYFHTTREPMSVLVAETRRLEQEEDGLLSVSICHGFGLADVAHTGAGILVVSNGEQQKAQEIAQSLGDQLFAIREQIKAPLCSIEYALDVVQKNGNGTVVIADTTDNTGGGAAGDSTFVLKAMIERNITNVALSLLWDPMAVDIAMKAGVGSQLAMRIGGKVGPHSGDPLDVMATILAVRSDAFQIMFSSKTPLGNAVALDIGGITVIVNSIREQVFDPRCFTELGVDPWKLKAVVVKSAQHFYAAFAPFAQQILYVDGPGSVTADFGKLPYKQLVRPIWPIDETPFTVGGREWS